MENKDSKPSQSLTLIELKAMAYDKIADIEQSMAYAQKLKEELQQINAQIQKAQSEKA